MSWLLWLTAFWWWWCSHIYNCNSKKLFYEFQKLVPNCLFSLRHYKGTSNSISLIGKHDLQIWFSLNMPSQWIILPFNCAKQKSKNDLCLPIFHSTHYQDRWILPLKYNVSQICPHLFISTTTFSVIHSLFPSLSTYTLVL